MALVIRDAAAEDADAIAAMAKDFAAYLRGLGDDTDFRFDAEAYRRDGFGRNRDFFGLVAEREKLIVGYLLYHFGYDVDRAARLIYVVDLWVIPEARRHGTARALMERLARFARDFGVSELVWSVYESNVLAMRFYESLGARPLKKLQFMHMRV